MTAKPTDAERITEVIRPTLDAFTIAAEPHVRKVAESLYEHLLGMTQDYLRENAEWNLGEEVLRCRRTEIENINLRERIRALEEALTEALGTLSWISEQAENAMAVSAGCATTSGDPEGGLEMLNSTASDIQINAAMLSDKLTAALSREAQP